MAKPACVKCGGTEFERQYGVVHPNRGVYFINCSSCGGVVSVIDRDTESAIEKLEQNAR
jgi:hypothetical protein